ncbi:hypothetical protein P152DRAFT_459952 [Eremomyces bilateralis CBS 781.70]|uniref:Uncharacterized protein n=1 Tax=Eremomyces bilateralis CBS 781.70 TaxID=1392243 RepID=A0A6G1FZ63_9PEZI|nr:uncharacterized protein P152DRAFT_459952 [Eremomyces bilateralis CBS 781.70]KAF1811068.1 hypothetical protein P152DRAFT_459952 [Eremomyces bilateralis CBS 781.70]
MSPEVICSVIFGIVAALIAMVGVLQTFFHRQAHQSDLEAQRVWFGQLPSHHRERLDVPFEVMGQPLEMSSPPPISYQDGGAQMNHFRPPEP